MRITSVSISDVRSAVSFLDDRTARADDLAVRFGKSEKQRCLSQLARERAVLATLEDIGVGGFFVTTDFCGEIRTNVID